MTTKDTKFLERIKNQNKKENTSERNMRYGVGNPNDIKCRAGDHSFIGRDICRNNCKQYKVYDTVIKKDGSVRYKKKCMRGY